MSYRRLPIYTNTPKPYSPYHYDYQISKKNDENKVLGGYIDESIRSTMRTESHYTPLKLASSSIITNNNQYYPQQRALSSGQRNYYQDPKYRAYHTVDDNESQRIQNRYPYNRESSYAPQDRRNNQLSYSQEIPSQDNRRYQDQQPLARITDQSMTISSNNPPQVHERYNNNNQNYYAQPPSYRNDYNNSIRNQNQYEQQKYSEVNKYAPQYEKTADLNINRARINHDSPQYRKYSPYQRDYERSRFGDYTYNYYLNAPMRGDRSEDWRYPPQYYYTPKYNKNTLTYNNY